MIDVETPQSPGWWLKRLVVKLEGRRPRLEKLDSYFRGDPPLPEGAETARQAYRAFQRKARTNYARLVVEAARQRMIPIGFRTGAAGDENGDAAARAIWNANGLDVESAEVHRSMLSMGDAYVIVGRDDSDGQVVMTAEDPRQVVTAHDPRRQRRVVAGLKMFTDDVAGLHVAYLYLPGRVLVAKSPEQKMSAPGLQSFNAERWDWDEQLSAPLGYDVVPVVRFRNERGVGEFEYHLDHLDRINHMLLQRMVVATMQAFRQRAVKGDLPSHDAEGNVINYDEVFASGPDALWLIPGAVEMWESGQVDLSPLLTSVRDDVKDLAAVTFTPLHYFTPDAASGSAEGASLAREGLVFRTEDRILRARDGWEQSMSLAFRFSGDAERAVLSSLQSMFAPPERYSLAERYDAAVKAGPAGVPWRTRMTEILQFSPETVARMERERGRDMLFGPSASLSRLPGEAA